MIVWLFLAVIAGLLIDVPVARSFTTPVLGALLFVTFLSIPLRRLRIDARLLAVLALLNFLVVPLVVGVITWPLRDDGVVYAAVLLVLLAPCIDYVIAFSGLAGGAREQLLAATPFLLLGQMLLLPLYLGLFLGSSGVMTPGPFLEAFLLLIVVPLALATLAQRSRWADFWAQAGERAMTPLMMATLFVVMAGYSADALQEWQLLLPPVAVYVLFAAVMLVLGWAIAGGAHLSTPARVSATFSGVTRNSLVVLPFAMAMPGAIAPVVVVTQTLVELVVMVAMVWSVPFVVRQNAA
ncbi:MAG: arsenic resistance protein [Corynebacterium sp.]|uniref:arsenic resistance protein n=1 Tax=Corynebacterium sp. TaxID=1720 RepID=UPI0026DF2FAB|nr:arsenic resistance protein [Corynebacterium sp.]MDO5670917.1 arsenic resistance protein [Corynebacterium sp.]